VGSLSAWFEGRLFGGSCKAKQGAVVTVIGSGGKTSLIWHLAAASAAVTHRRILVSPTTKMFVPPGQAKLWDRYYGGGTYGELPYGRGAGPLPGVTLVGRFNETSGKLESLPLPELKRIAPAYDLVLLEGDGSRGLPLKAWTQDEPVVPAFTDLTVGILPLWPLGKPVSENIVHRLPLFLALTGAEAGETLKPAHILALITGKTRSSGPKEANGSPLPGLFAKARGEKLLFFNQIEDDGALKQARELASLIPSPFRENLSGIAAGSVKENLITEL